MFLLILESIGTPELIFIALVALIVLGPRKLPQMMKTVGKTMAEFRNATNEFKTTWEREVNFQEQSPAEKSNSLIGDPVGVENRLAENSEPSLNESRLSAPEVREISAEDFTKNFPEKKAEIAETQPSEFRAEKTTADKTDWL